MVSIEPEKVVFEQKKVMIEQEEVAIESRKVAIGETLNATNFTESTKRKIKKLYETFGVQTIIGRSDIVKVTGESLTAAGKLINKMKEVGLLEPVTGHGKGKYRFKIGK